MTDETTKQRKERKARNRQKAIELIRQNPQITPWDIARELEGTPTSYVSYVDVIRLVEPYGWIYIGPWHELRADDGRRKFNADGTPRSKERAGTTGKDAA